MESKDGLRRKAGGALALAWQRCWAYIWCWSCLSLQEFWVGKVTVHCYGFAYLPF